MLLRNRLLLLPIAAFVVLFTCVSFYNRYATDDFEFLNKLHEYGWAGSVQWFHAHWNTRWSAIALLNLVLLITQSVGSLWWYHLMSLGLLTWGFQRNVKHVCQTTTATSWLLGSYLAVALFYCCFSISDVFFWVNTSTMYLYGIIALLFAISEITTHNHTVMSYLRLACFGLCTAGAYEALVFTIMTVCVVTLVIQWKKNEWQVWQMPFDKKVVILLSALIFGFAISYWGEGHLIRSSYLPQTTFAVKMLAWIKSSIKMFVFHWPQSMLIALFIAFPFFIAGTRHSGKTVPIKTVKIAAFVLLLLIFISMFPVAFIMSEMGPERAWTQVALFSVLFAAFISWTAGTLIGKRWMHYQPEGIFVTGALIFICSTGIPAAVKSSKYAKGWDKRIELLRNHTSSSGDTITVVPLPDPGWLHSAEISESADFYHNRFLKVFLKSGFEIRRAEK